MATTADQIEPEENGHYDYVTQLESDRLPPLDRGPYTYLDGIDVFHHDGYREHVTKVILVGEHGRTVLCSRSGVLWYDWETDVENEEAERLAVALSDTTLTGFEGGPEIEQPDRYEKVVGGWHDSQFPSSQSEIMNKLAKGNTPDNWGSEMFPYAVKYGDTNNVCSLPASIYANEELQDEFSQLFEGKRATPRRGGFW